MIAVRLQPHLFTAGEAAKITGMSMQMQRTNRQRGILRQPKIEKNKAVLTINEIAEMGFVEALAAANLLDVRQEEAVRRAGTWVSHWMMETAGCIFDPNGLKAQSVIGEASIADHLKGDKQPSRFLFASRGRPSFFWTGDSIEELHAAPKGGNDDEFLKLFRRRARIDPVSVAINLEMIGSNMVRSTGRPFLTLVAD